MSDPVASTAIGTLMGGCTDPDCGRPVEIGPQTLHTAAVIRHFAECQGCGRRYIVTVTMRRAVRADMEAWADPADPDMLRRMVRRSTEVPGQVLLFGDFDG